MEPMTEQYDFKYLDTVYLSKFLNNEINLDIQNTHISSFDSMQSYELHENICKYWALDLYNFYKENKQNISIENLIYEYFEVYNNDNTFSSDHIENIKHLINEGINIINFEKIEKYIEDNIEEYEDEEFYLEMEKYNNQEYECDSP